MVQWSKISRKEKIGLALAAAVVMVAIGDRLVLHPISERIVRLRSEVKTNELKLIMALRNLKEKDRVMMTIKSHEKFLRKASSDEEETAQSLAAIESLARQNGLYISDIRPQSSRKYSFYNEYKIDANLEGTPEALMQFLYHINDADDLIYAEKIHLTAKDKDSNIIKGSISLVKITVS